ncbi:MAG: choice-of-anchor D domain-containing protein [Deltaproteobacteria bacterium]|nr:choice-of-anchor D domain-containing protein [Deltaproteobacteria bacterium]
MGAGRALLPSLLVTLISACGPGTTTGSDASNVDAAPSDAATALDAPEIADLVIDRDELDFGWVCRGRAAEVAVTFVNASRFVSSAIEASIAGEDAGMFAVVESSCGGGLQPRSFCSVLVRFAPSTEGQADATLELTAREAAWSLPLTGESPSCESRFTVSPTPHTFPETEPGARSDVAFFTITNHASFRTLPLTVGVSGLDLREFQIARDGDTCSARSVPAFGTCTVGVVYAPSRVGTHMGQLQVYQADDFVQAALSGRSLSPAAPVFSPRMLDFGTSCGFTSDVVLSNEGGLATGPITLLLEGGDTSAFEIVSDTCSAGLEADASCVITLRFVDGLPATAYSTTLFASWAGRAIELPISGTRPNDCGGYVVMEPSTYDFGERTVGDVSAPMRFTVRNVGATPRGPFVVVLRSGSPAEFGVSASTCAGRMLAASETCTVDVTFAPTLSGDASTILDADDGRMRATAALRGHGI